MNNEEMKNRLYGVIEEIDEPSIIQKIGEIVKELDEQTTGEVREGNNLEKAHDREALANCIGDFLKQSFIANVFLRDHWVMLTKLEGVTIEDLVEIVGGIPYSDKTAFNQIFDSLDPVSAMKLLAEIRKKAEEAKNDEHH